MNCVGTCAYGRAQLRRLLLPGDVFCFLCCFLFVTLRVFFFFLLFIWSLCGVYVFFHVLPVLGAVSTRQYFIPHRNQLLQLLPIPPRIFYDFVGRQKGDTRSYIAVIKRMLKCSKALERLLFHNGSRIGRAFIYVFCFDVIRTHSFALNVS